MNNQHIETRLCESIDELAAIEHDRWAHWQRYMHSKGKRLDDGSLVLPPELVKRWEAQIATPYADLTEAERKSDQDQVRRYIPSVARIISG